MLPQTTRHIFLIFVRIFFFFKFLFPFITDNSFLEIGELTYVSYVLTSARTPTHDARAVGMTVHRNIRSGERRAIKFLRCVDRRWQIQIRLHRWLDSRLYTDLLLSFSICFSVFFFILFLIFFLLCNRLSLLPRHYDYVNFTTQEPLYGRFFIIFFCLPSPSPHQKSLYMDLKYVSRVADEISFLAGVFDEWSSHSRLVARSLRRRVSRAREKPIFFHVFADTRTTGPIAGRRESRRELRKDLSSPRRSHTITRDTRIWIKFSCR